MGRMEKGTSSGMIVILFTTAAPDPLTGEPSQQGHTVYEAVAISEVYALADQHPLATIIITADVDPNEQEHYPNPHLI